MNRRALAFALAAAVGVSAPAWADIFSPGDLARGHEQLDGMRNCTQCHPAGAKLSQETCLACHTELKPEVAAGKGYHGRISHDERECEKCHSEHQGRDLKLTDWGGGGIRSFDHRKAGWPLLGKHAPVTCTGCHDKRLVVDSAILKLIAAEPRRENPTMLGLATRCDACHFDEHRGQTAKTCETCHNEKAWAPAPGFNHQKTAYPLEGKHRKVPCEKCHPANKDEATAADAFPKPVSMTFMKYAPIAHRECLSCHEDPHKGEFGDRCQRCHTVDGWMLIKDRMKDTAFHDKTRYPLRGEHVNVSCVACHGPFPGIAAQFKNMKFEACIDCHVDAHEGQMPKASPAAPGPRCEQCHTVDGFKPTLFELAEHQKTRYPLEGAHKVVACAGCHAPESKLQAQVPAATRAFLRARKREDLFSLATFLMPKVKPQGACESCHADLHAGQFSPRKGCTGCHGLASWKELAFDHDKDSAFPLAGKHASTACASCHPMTTLRALRTVQYVGVEKTCDGCHADVHVGQFSKRNGGKGDCGECHGVSDWKAERFSHRPPFTNYLLEGAHEKVECKACHPSVQVAAGVTAVRYKPLPANCQGCHADFHKGEFKGFVP